MIGRWTPLATVALISLIAVAAYWPGLGGPFLMDDYTNFVRNPLVQIRDFSFDSLASAWSSNRSGAIARPLPGLSFGLNYLLADTSFDPVAFKAVNLAIHLVNATLVYLAALAIVRAATARAGRPSVPEGQVAVVVGLAAALWALHPIQLSNVLYVVQRINAMAALGVFGGLVVWLAGRQRLLDGRPGAWPRMIGGLVGGGLLGVLSKENAALLPALALAVELTVFRGAVASPDDRRRLVLAHGVLGVAPLVLAALVAIFVLDLWAPAYALRDFDVVERVMTQARVLWWYLWQLLVPDIRELTFFHNHWQASRGLLDPPTTLAAIVALVVAGGGAAALLRVTPWPAFGLAWFLVAHAMESTVVPLELVFEHRNYVPAFGVMLAAVALAAQLLARVPVSAVLKGSLAALVLLAFTGITHLQAGVWSDRHNLVMVSLERRPDSWRLHYELAVTLQERTGDVRAMYAALAHASEAAPEMIMPNISMLRLVTFIELAQAYRGGGEAAPVLDRDGRVLFTADPAGLAAERTRLVARVGEILGGLDGLEPNALVSFMALANCADEGREECLVLVDAMESWTGAVMNNAQMPIGPKQSFTWLRARMRLATSNVSGVIPSIQEGIDLGPTRVQLLLYRVNLAIRMDEKEQAAKWLDEIRALPLDINDQRQVRELTERLGQ